METLYTAEALATGDGRNGHTKTTDGYIDLDLKVPEGMGGPGGAANLRTSSRPATPPASTAR